MVKGAFKLDVWQNGRRGTDEPGNVAPCAQCLPPWQDTSADATGTAAHFRIKASATCHIQGTVGTSGTDMIVDSVSFTAGQQFTVTAFTLSDGNA